TEGQDLPKVFIGSVEAVPGPRASSTLGGNRTGGSDPRKTMLRRYLRVNDIRSPVFAATVQEQEHRPPAERWTPRRSSDPGHVNLVAMIEELFRHGEACRRDSRRTLPHRRTPTVDCRGQAGLHATKPTSRTRSTCPMAAHPRP